MKIVVTGGAGYIGSYVCRALLTAGHKLWVIDDLSTGRQENLPAEVDFFLADFADEKLWQQLSSKDIDVVIHLAAKIDAAESVEKPELYLRENSEKTLQLLNILSDFPIEGIIFASSAAVYGDAEQIPTPETAELKPLNPYGKSKVLAEQALQDFAKSGKRAIALRFFNVAGTLPEIVIRPRLEAALITAIKKSLENPQVSLKVFGSDYPTADGSCERDFVHVADIAQAFVAVIENWSSLKEFEAINIGTGQAHSVLEVVSRAEALLGKSIKFQIVEPRVDEIVVSAADNAKMKQLLQLQLRYSDLDNILKTSL